MRHPFRNIDKASVLRLFMTNQVRKSDLNDYISRHSGETVSTITDNGLLFEALCEMIVEKNPDSTVEKLAEEYNHKV